MFEVLVVFVENKFSFLSFVIWFFLMLFLCVFSMCVFELLIVVDNKSGIGWCLICSKIKMISSNVIIIFFVVVLKYFVWLDECK